MAESTQKPAWLPALSPYLKEVVSVPLATPVRTRVGELIPDVRGAVLRLPRWTGPAFTDDFGKKGAGFVELDGEHLFAELAVLRLLQRDGWDGRWVTTHGGKHGEIWKLLTRWADVPRAEQRHAPIEDAQARQLLASIAGANRPARYTGCWDVYAWRDGVYLFLECKKTSSSKPDPVKAQECDWMHMAIAAQPAQFNADSFCVVLWDYI